MYRKELSHNLTLEEIQFLYKTPWFLDAYKQDENNLHAEIITSQNKYLAQPESLTIKFSFITPLWNTPPKYLEELIFSLRLQSYPNWEIILVDDASHNKSHFELIEKWTKIDPRILFFPSEKNSGISGGRNKALSHTTGDFILILDHDDIIHPQALEIFYSHLNQNKDINFIFSNEATIDELSAQVTQFFSKPNFSLFNLSRNNYICHLTAIQKSFLFEYGNTTDGIFRSQYDGAEDHDLFLRLALSGKVNAKHIPLFLYYWRRAETSTALSIDTKPKAYIRGCEMLKELMCPFYKITPSDIHIDHPSDKHDFYQYRFSIIANQKIKICIEAKEDEYLQQTLQSLKNQHNASQFEIIIYNPIDTSSHENFIFKNKQENSHPYYLFLTEGVEFQDKHAISRLIFELSSHAEAQMIGIRGQLGSKNLGFLRIKTGLVGSGYFSIAEADNTEDHIFDEMLVFGLPLHCFMVKQSIFTAFKFSHYEKLSDMEWALILNNSGFKSIYLGNLTYSLPKEFSSCRKYPTHLKIIELNTTFQSILNNERLRIININLQLKWNQIASYEPYGSSSKLRYAFLEKKIFPLLYKASDNATYILKKYFKPLFKIMRKKIS